MGILDKLKERYRRAEKSRIRAARFGEAQAIHEKFLVDNCVDIYELSPTTRSAAASSPELKMAERSYRETMNLSHADGAYADEAVVWYQLGLLYLMQGRLDEASDSASAALRLLEKSARSSESEVRVRRDCHYALGLAAAETRDKGKLSSAIRTIETLHKEMGLANCPSELLGLREKLEKL